MAAPPDTGATCWCCCCCWTKHSVTVGRLRAAEDQYKINLVTAKEGAVGECSRSSLSSAVVVGPLLLCCTTRQEPWPVVHHHSCQKARGLCSGEWSRRTLPRRMYLAQAAVSSMTAIFVTQVEAAAALLAEELPRSNCVCACVCVGHH